MGYHSFLKHRQTNPCMYCDFSVSRARKGLTGADGGYFTITTYSEHIYIPGICFSFEVTNYTEYIGWGETHVAIHIYTKQ